MVWKVGTRHFFRWDSEVMGHGSASEMKSLHAWRKSVLLVSFLLSETYMLREGFKKNLKNMVALIHRGWLAGVSLGPKSNPKKYCFEEKKTKMIRIV